MDGSGSTFDVSGLTGDFDGAFFAGGGIARIEAQAGRLPAIDIAGKRIGPPIARPGAVLCIGMNYEAHAAESGSAPPKAPVLFYKSPNTVIGPNDEVLVPRGSGKTDWEVELGVVIGRTARYLPSRQAALECVAGYVLSNDVSERSFQLENSGGQWSKGKSCETFNPLGPYLVTDDEIGDPQDLTLRSWVNDEPRQDSNTRDMIFDVAEIIYQLSQVLVLDPGRSAQYRYATRCCALRSLSLSESRRRDGAGDPGPWSATPAPRAGLIDSRKCRPEASLR